jgi:hypothetical protein
MEPERSLPCLQEPSTSPYSEPDQSNQYHAAHHSKIHINIVHPPLTRVEAGSNTSTVTLRVVRGDEMGLKKAAP